MEWLKQFCDDDYHLSYLREPLSLERQGRAGAVASDVRILVWVAGDSPFRAATKDEKKSLAHVLDLNVRRIGQTTAAALREWAGAPPVPADPTTCTQCAGTGKVKCDECSGTGEHECPHCEQDMTCEKCEGDGKMECPACDLGTVIEEAPPRRGRVQGQPFDMLRLAKALVHVEGACEVFLSVTPGVLFLRGGGWEIATANAWRDDDSVEHRGEIPLEVVATEDSPHV